MQAALHPFPVILQYLASMLVPGSPRRLAASRSRYLARHGTFRLARADRVVHVLEGCVWITCDGDPQDVVLEAGGRFAHERGTRVLVHALADARLVLAG